MRTQHLSIVALLAGAIAMAAPVFADSPSTAADKTPSATTVVLPPIDPKGGVTIPPEMIDALKKLTDDDYKIREDAVAKLQQVMTRQFQQMVVLQNLMLRVQVGLAQQLKELTQGQEGERQARVAGLMEFNSAMSRWAIDVMALPDKERESLLKWGLKDENLPLIARAYSRSDEVRGKAAREFAKLPGAEADWMLVQLLNDASREVSLNAIDAIYDRKPSPAVVATLWERATASAMAQIRQRPSRQKIINVHGRMVSVYDQDYAAQARMQDADVVVDILVKYKDPQVLEKLNALFVELAAPASSPNDYRWRIMSPNYGDGGRALSRLVDAYKPREAVVFLVKVLGMPMNDGSDTTMNNEKFRYSSRIDSAAMLVKVTGQDPDEYKIKKHPDWGERWLIKGGIAEEEAMVKKLQAWWKEHAADYGQTAPDAISEKSATTVPATRPQ